MKRNVLLGLVLTLISGVAISSCDTPNDEKEKLYVGLECAYAPFNWTENQPTDTNHPIAQSNTYAEGYDIQIAKIIAEELDMELVIKKMDFGGLIPAVQNGDIDLIIAGMSPTPSRLVDIDFTAPYYTSEHVLLVKKDNPFANVTSVSQLDGASIAGQIGTLYDDIAHAISNVDSSGDRPTVSEIITLLQSDMIDGTVLELPVAQGLVAANPDFKFIQFAAGQGFTKLIDEDTNQIRDIVDTDKDVAIGLAKNKDELKASINEILSTISQEQRNQLMSNAVNMQSE